MVRSPFEVSGNTSLLWNKYYHHWVENDSVLFDPVSLSSAFLNASEAARIDANDPEILAQLKSLGFINSPYPTAPTNLLQSRLDQAGLHGTPSHIMGYRVVLTDKCNMTCSYCFVDTNTGNDDMTREDLQYGLDYLIDSNASREMVTLQWFGGEPTIRFDQMKWGDEYATERGKKLNVQVRPVVVTNGVKLTDEMIEHYQKFHYGIGVSLDGMPDTNRERSLLSGKEADPRIHKNIRRMLEAGIDVGANVTPTLRNATRMVEIAGYLLDLGIRFIYVNTPIPVGGRWTVPGAELAESLFKARLYTYGRGGMLFSHLDRLYQGLDTRVPRVYEHVQRDGGIRVALLPARKISVLDLNWKEEQFIHHIDEIRDDPSILSAAKKTLLPSRRCQTCPAMSICGGPTLNERLVRGTAEPDPELCAFFVRGLELALTDNTGLQ